MKTMKINELLEELETSNSVTMDLIEEIRHSEGIKLSSQQLSTLQQIYVMLGEVESKIVKL